MKRFLISTLLCISILLSIAPIIHADAGPAARDITKSTTISGSGFSSFSFLKDKNVDIYKESKGKTKIKLENSDGIFGIYLLFHLECGEYQIENQDTGAVITAGQYGFLHEYIDLHAAFKGAPTAITLHFADEGIQLSEIYTFSAGQTPSFVQKWQPPLEGKTDLLLLSTHGDDEQLFFAGLLPYYAGEKKINVQVVYMTNHRNITLDRTHEMLNGLWGVGVTSYPVFGNFQDIRIDNMEELYIGYGTYGVKKSAFVEFVVDNIRRFKPKVIVGHDINGEYGHGMHMIYTDCLIDALPLTSDASQFPDSADKYGTWDVPKTYLHLYEENAIVMDYDQPLSSFNGLTAFQVTQKYGFIRHKSQHKYWFYQWIYGENNEITKASQIETYSPCQFGLYQSTVGVDQQKNDFMENVTTHEEDLRMEQERLEKERLEQERLEKERLEKEQLEKALTQLQQEQERLEKEKQRLQQKYLLILVAIISSVILFAIALYILLLPIIRRKRKRSAKIHK